MTPDEFDQITVPPDRRPASEQPKWRKDFPIDVGQDEYVSRRDLVKFIVLTSGAFVVGQFWLVARKVFGGGSKEEKALAIASVDEVPVGGSKVFHYPADDVSPRILVRLSEREFVAYDQQCTHLLCPVIPDVEAGTFNCPCHHGSFDIRTGRQLAGPPPRPLARVDIEVRNATIYATGMSA